MPVTRWKFQLTSSIVYRQQVTMRFGSPFTFSRKADREKESLGRLPETKTRTRRGPDPTAMFGPVAPRVIRLIAGRQKKLFQITL